MASVLLTFGTRHSLLWGHLGPCRMLSGVPDLHPLEARSILPVVTIKNVSKCCQLSSGGQNGPGWRTSTLSRSAYAYAPILGVFMPFPVGVPCVHTACVCPGYLPWVCVLCCMDLLGVLYLYCLYMRGNPMGRGCFCLLPCFSRRLCVRVFVCM